MEVVVFESRRLMRDDVRFFLADYDALSGPSRHLQSCEYISKCYNDFHEFASEDETVKEYLHVGK